MDNEKITPEKVEEAFNLGLATYERLKGKKIKTPADVLEVLTVLSETANKAKEEFGFGEKTKESDKMSSTLQELLNKVGQIENDSAELRFLTEKVKQLAKKKIINLEQAEKYVMLGLKIALIVKALI